MEKSRIFISYKRDNKEVVFKIKDDIEKNVGEKCWVDFDGIESDAQFVNVIINAIDEADVFIFVYSKRHADITDFQNDWTIRELLYAGHEKKRIVFLNIDNTPLSDYFMLMFGTKLQVDVNSNNAMNQLYLDLRKWLGVKSDEMIVEKPKTSSVVVAQKNKRGERIFISYKRKDKRAVFRIKDDIERHIGEKCWIDLNGIESDAYFVDVIMSAINQADVFLFMYSKRHSDIIDTKKDWTVRELNFAEKKEKKIVFINLDNSKLTDYFEMMYGLKQQVYADSEEAMNNLYVDLSKWLKIDCFPNVLPDNKEWNLGKIKKLWSKFKIFFRIRFLFVLLICFFGGAVYLYNYFHQEKHIIPEPDKFEQEMVISNFNRALYMSDINAINMFFSVFISFLLFLFNNIADVRQHPDKRHRQCVINKVESLVRGSLLVDYTADIPHYVSRVTIDENPAERRHTLVQHLLAHVLEVTDAIE